MSQNNPFTINQVKPKFKSEAIHYITDKEIKGAKTLVLSKVALTVIFLTFLFLLIFSNQQANAGCTVGGNQYNIGGRAGSGVTAVVQANGYINLARLQSWGLHTPDTDDVSTCDVSQITSLSGAFRNHPGERTANFNDDIGSWDVSNVTNMVMAFQEASSFNSDISGWDTSNVTTMKYAFDNASVFNSNIGSWDVSNVTNFLKTFYRAFAFNGNISGWDTGSATNMKRMFTGHYGTTSAFNQDIWGWDISNVTDMSQMFYYAQGMLAAYPDKLNSNYIVSSDAFNASPTLSSSTPADNATNVVKDGTIVLNFSKNVVVGSGNITIKIASSDVSIETIEVNNPEVTGSGTSQITIDPQTNWGQNTEYYVLIDATAFDDTSGNSYEGISSTTALTFTVANDTPILSTSVPANNATSVALDANIVLNFSENVTAQSGNITIKKADNTIFETISVADTTKVTGTGTNQITINPSSDFVLNTDYYVLIDGTAFDDANSGSYAGIGLFLHMIHY